jgi:hypothetical protein
MNSLISLSPNLLLLFIFLSSVFLFTFSYPIYLYTFLRPFHSQISLYHLSLLCIFGGIAYAYLRSRVESNQVHTSILTLLSWRQANVYRFSKTEWISTLFIRRSSDVKPNTILSEVMWSSKRISQVVSSSLPLVIFWRYSAPRILWDSVEKRNNKKREKFET